MDKRRTKQLKVQRGSGNDVNYDPVSLRPLPRLLIERLLTLLHAFDQEIEIVIRDKPKSKRPARLVVRIAA